MEARQFRPAAAGDRAAVWALWSACAADERCLWNADYPTEAYLKQDLGNGWLHVLLEDGRLIGAVTLMPPGTVERQGFPFAEAEPIAELTRLCVQPPLWRRGVGGALLALTEAYAASGGARAIHLLCDVRNAPALALFARSGYREVCRASLYGDRFSVREKLLTNVRAL